MEIRYDCRHFKGYSPCKANKERGKKCKCDEYEKRGKRILIIKLDAMGDVLRTTPIVRKLRSEYPNCEITWLTKTIQLAEADVKIEYNQYGILRVLGDEFDIAYNFDKSPEACALMNLINSEKKKGFILKNGQCFPIDKDAEEKFLTGIFDDIGEKNEKSYVQETFEIAGFDFSKEKYILQSEKKFKIKTKKPLIGLNTGAGAGWPGRVWPTKYWEQLALLLKKAGYNVVLLGGEKEHKINKKIKEKTGVNYFGYFPLDEFISLVDECDMVITSVTLALHIAIGLEKKILLLNSVFNKNEFELYGLGEIIEPPVKGKYYSQKYEEGNMDKLLPKTVFSKAVEIIKR